MLAILLSGFLHVNTADSLIELFHEVSFGFISQLTSDLIIHYVLAILLSIHFSYLPTFMSLLMFHLSIFDALYNKSLIHSLISLDGGGGLLIAYWSMPGPEIDFHSIIMFLKVKLSTIITYVFIYWYWMTFGQIFLVCVFCQSIWNWNFIHYEIVY